METIADPIFQIDSPLVTSAYNNPNFLIEFDEQSHNNLCAVYFASHNIYYPNTEKDFIANLVKKDKYEWYGTRIGGARKHIFLRDIKKQWYLTGINSTINSPYKLEEFLLSETKDYKVITVGSSAGGYAAVVYGQRINAERIYCFNGQQELFSLLDTSNERINPLIFRNSDNPALGKYYDARNFITNPGKIYYFYSNKSKWDISQYEHVKDLGINILSFNTNIHGMPFLKCNTPPLLAMEENVLRKYVGRRNNPIIFSFRIVGFYKTIEGLYNQVKGKLKEKYENFLVEIRTQ
jgi:hypothetical protein